MSPDGKLIAYAWVTPAYEWATEDRLIELRIVGIDGSGLRVLYANRDVLLFNGARLNLQLNPPLRVHEWSPDGKYVAATVFQKDRSQLVLFSVADASVRVLRRQVLKTLRASSYWNKMKFSPDGRFVAYDLTPQGGSHRDIFEIPAEGGPEIPLVQHPANDLLLAWTPDGRGVLFASDRSGHWDLWVIQVSDGKPRGSAQMVYPNSGPFASGLGFTAWSPDGRAIFERWPPQRILTRNLETGEERELYRPVPPAQVHHWPTSNLAVSPNGQRLAFAWTDAKNVERTTALMVLPTAGGEPRELLRAQEPERISVPAWMPDSRHIIYARSVAGEKPQFELWRISTDGGEPQKLGLAMEGMLPYGLSVHPDGKRIAFTAGTEREEVWVLKNFLPAAKQPVDGPR